MEEVAQAMAQQTPHWIDEERALDSPAREVGFGQLGAGMTVEPRGNGELEPRDVDASLDKLERVLGW